MELCEEALWMYIANAWYSWVFGSGSCQQSGHGDGWQGSNLTGSSNQGPATQASGFNVALRNVKPSVVLCAGQTDANVELRWLQSEHRRSGAPIGSHWPCAMSMQWWSVL